MVAGVNGLAGRTLQSANFSAIFQADFHY